MTTTESAQILAVLTAAYPNAYKNLSDNEAAAVALVWASQFADMPYDIVFMALQKAISSCKYPPTICEVKEMVGKLYWEAFDITRNSQGYGALPEAEAAVYARIIKHTEKFRCHNSAPELKDMLNYSQQALYAGAIEGGKK